MNSDSAPVDQRSPFSPRALFLLVLAAGCSANFAPAAPGWTNPELDAGARSELDSYFDRVRAAECDLATKCGALHPYLRDRCIEQARRAFERGRTAELDAGYWRFDLDAGARCLDEAARLDAGTCFVLSAMARCGQGWIPNSQLGEACTGGSCQQGRCRYRADSGGAWLCTPDEAIGEPCTDSSFCVETAYCATSVDGGTRFCTARKPAGEPCTSGQCLAICLPAVDGGGTVCGPRQPGEPCDPGAQCAADAYCVGDAIPEDGGGWRPGICRARVGLGNACNDQENDFRQGCLDGDAVCLGGRCVVSPFYSVPPGGACNRSGQCELSCYCDLVLGTCRARQPLGALCNWEGQGTSPETPLTGSCQLGLVCRNRCGLPPVPFGPCSPASVGTWCVQGYSACVVAPDGGISCQLLPTEGEACWPADTFVQPCDTYLACRSSPSADGGMVASCQ